MDFTYLNRWNLGFLFGSSAPEIDYYKHSQSQSESATDKIEKTTQSDKHTNKTDTQTELTEILLKKELRKNKIFMESGLNLGHVVEYDNLSELATLLQNDPTIINEIISLTYALKFPPAAQSDFSLTKYENIYARLLGLLKFWVKEKGTNATYEELKRGLKERHLNKAAEGGNKILQQRIILSDGTVDGP